MKELLAGDFLDRENAETVLLYSEEEEHKFTVVLRDPEYPGGIREVPFEAPNEHLAMKEYDRQVNELKKKLKPKCHEPEDLPNVSAFEATKADIERRRQEYQGGNNDG
jgi:hypothetical protein